MKEKKMDKLLQLSYYIIQNAGFPISRVELAKLVYYADGLFFQHTGSTISDEKYIHLETSPSPVRFHEAICFLVEKDYVEAYPNIGNDRGCIRGFFLRTERNFAIDLEKKALMRVNKVLRSFKNGLVDEDTVFPNLYENYVITPLYTEIKFQTSTLNTKIKISKRKRFLDLSGKIFKIIYHP
jgi:hypothetical protein